MKNLNHIISILALAILAGCAKIEVDVPASQEQEEISFTVANRSAQTKASEFSKTESFAVFGLYTGSYTYNSINFADAAIYMNNVSVSYSSSKWASTKQYYWPKTGKLSFVAYWPTSAAVQLGDSRSNVLKITGYDVQETYKSQTAQQDLLVSSVSKDCSISTKTVALTFRHALSQVKFMGKTVAANNGLTYHVTINSISINNIYDQGDYKFDSTTDKSVWTVNTGKGLTSSGDIYNPGNTPQTAGNTYVAAKDELTTSFKALGTGSKAYFVLPQSLNANAVVSVSYTIYTCNNSGKILDALNGTSDIKLNTLGTPAIAAWESGKSYTYNFTISPVSSDVITFEPSVEDWSTTEESVIL